MSVNDVKEMMFWLLQQSAPIAIVIALTRYGASVILDAVSGRGLKL